MLRHLGYAGPNLSLGITSGRGTVLWHVTPEKLRSLIRENLQALGEILAFNTAHRIYLYRISSRIIPFASHPSNRLSWWVEFAGRLAQLGDHITQQGMRVSMHPGQYTVLNSGNPRVVEAAIADLEWHTRFLDSMGLGPEHKIVIHAGGSYGDKAAATRQMVENYRLLPSAVRQRLIVENDGQNYTVEEVLAISRQTGMPVVLDWLHHQTNPSGTDDLHTLLRRCFATWHRRDGLPKVHFSSQAVGKRPGSHSEYVDAVEFLHFYQQTRELDFDCMLEAKAKDLALLRLRQELNWIPLAA